ncbi:hypothetical protein Tco_0801378 [Tanacetum coccineum]|uniref:Uncharacterized protein n=1 Tax=Tanacetum coccineum TaxID=301880 RepID=A0ABQ4ZVT6_9ASTR
MSDTGVLEEQEKGVAEKEVSAVDPVTTANVKATTSNVPTTTIDELTLAQTLTEIKAAKPKAVTFAATITTTTRPKARGVVVQEQTMMEADFELAQRLQAEEQGEITIEERSRLFESSKRVGDELESDMSKKQKIDEHVEVEKDDQEEAEMKMHIEIVKDDEVELDVIPLATKPLVIVEYKIDKDGKMGYFKLIRANGSLKRYSSMIKMLQGIDREDLETLWKLVKAKHKNTRLEEDYERVLWGDLKVMFEPDIKSEVWRNQQGYKVTVWKLFDNCRVHFVRFRNLHIFMLVEKRYPLTPITISNMLNKKLQADHWNEMCYQLLKLMTKQEKG